MGRKFIIEEVEEESKFGCGSIVATIIIALVIGLCGGFKSCKVFTTDYYSIFYR